MKNSRSRLSSLDLRLIARLQIDAHRSNTDLARELHVAESTVRRRINWLTREGYIQIVALTEPFKVGFTTWAMGEVQTVLRQRDAVARRLARCPEISFVAVTTGVYDILFTAVFRSSEEFDTFITKELSRIPGIKHVTTASILRLTKRTFAYGVPTDHDGVVRDRSPQHQATRKRDARPARPSLSSLGIPKERP
jgi:Lrp/AsnC family transcriptional regulator for asnA, asnC and gidA